MAGLHEEDVPIIKQLISYQQYTLLTTSCGRGLINGRKLGEATYNPPVVGGAKMYI